jgi:aminoglycoside 6'-N-acetyltransferase
VVFVAGDLSVRRLGEGDVGTMVRWLSDPRVAEWYEGRDVVFDAADVRRKFLRPGDSVLRCVIEEGERPIGFLQVYAHDADELEEMGMVAAEAPVCGIDLFIGEPTLWNGGRGTRLVRAATEHLIEAWGAVEVTIDPFVHNGRAIRAYEKAGFRKDRVLPAHDVIEGVARDAWLMKYEPTAPREPGAG